MSRDEQVAARSGRVYLDGDQALFAGLVRAEFGPAARIVLFDGDAGSLYAEVEAGHAGHCIQRFDRETCESEWMGDCENVPNPVYVSDFRSVVAEDLTAATPLAREWAAPAFVLAAFPFGLAISLLFGGSGVTFALGVIVLALVGVAVCVWSLRPSLLSRAESVTVGRFAHSSLCAVNATGHRGPCTCGGQRGR